MNAPGWVFGSARRAARRALAAVGVGLVVIALAACGQAQSGTGAAVAPTSAAAERATDSAPTRAPEPTAAPTSATESAPMGAPEPTAAAGNPIGRRPHADPPTLPTPSGAQGATTSETQTPQGVERTIRFQTSDAPEKVLDWYHSTLLAAGWQEQMGPSQPDYVIHEGCPNYALHIDAAASGGQTQVELQLRPALCA